MGNSLRFPRSAQPSALNNVGTVAGNASAGLTIGPHAFKFQNGSIADLGTLPDYPRSSAIGINDAGDVVGDSFNNAGTQFHAFLFRNGTLTDLGAGAAVAINNSGDIVGTSEATRAVRYQNGMVTDLGNFGDSDLTRALDINNTGLIVGTAFVQLPNNTFVNHPFLYESGVWHDLGLPAGVPLGIPSAINNLGQIVGNSNQSLGASDRPPFVYTSGSIYNLQSLLDSSGTGLNLQLAYDINDSGVILAQGQTSTGYQAVLLTPVSEPSAAFLTMVGAIFAYFSLSYCKLTDPQRVRLSKLRKFIPLSVHSGLLLVGAVDDGTRG
jgi:probable HAF family extracellular repeat protein